MFIKINPRGYYKFWFMGRFKQFPFYIDNPYGFGIINLVKWYWYKSHIYQSIMQRYWHKHKSDVMSYYDELAFGVKQEDK